jgi:hypothetical protein
MSDSTATTLGAYAGYISLGIAIGGMVVSVFNRKKCRSMCCGHVAEVSLDISTLTPPTTDKPSVVVEEPPTLNK